jgi:hypothetical protein
VIRSIEAKAREVRESQLVKNLDYAQNPSPQHTTALGGEQPAQTCVMA